MIEIKFLKPNSARDTIINYRGVNYFFRLEEFDKKIDEYTREFK